MPVQVCACLAEGKTVSPGDTNLFVHSHQCAELLDCGPGWLFSSPTCRRAQSVVWEGGSCEAAEIAAAVEADSCWRSLCFCLPPLCRGLAARCEETDLFY